MIVNKERFNIAELSILYPKSIRKLEWFCDEHNGSFIRSEVDYLTFLRFFDSYKLFIGISADDSGTYWYVDISELQIDCVSSRDEAEVLAITECFEMLETILE